MKHRWNERKREKYLAIIVEFFRNNISNDEHWLNILEIHNDVKQFKRNGLMAVKKSDLGDLDDKIDMLTDNTKKSLKSANAKITNLQKKSKESVDLEWFQDNLERMLIEMGVLKPVVIKTISKKSDAKIIPLKTTGKKLKNLLRRKDQK